MASNLGSRLVLLALALALSATQPAAAQVDHAVEALSRTLGPGDSVFVTTHDTGEQRGQFVRVSPDGIVLTSAGREQTIPLDNVGWIEKRGDPLWNGALIGAILLGLPAMGGAGASCSPNCESAVRNALFGGLALGAGVGALIDWMIPGRTLVYGSRPVSFHGVFAPAVPGSLESRRSLASLWSRVKPGDKVTVRTTAATEVVGRFARASESSVTVIVGDDAREIPATGVTQIIRHRGGTHVKLGLSIGIPVGALQGSGPCYRIDEPWSVQNGPRLSCGAGVLLGAAAGGAVGALLGGMTFGKAVVYSSSPDSTEGPHVSSQSATRITVAPLASPHRIGLIASCSF